jgi:hypothetical protein
MQTMSYLDMSVLVAALTKLAPGITAMSIPSYSCSLTHTHQVSVSMGRGSGV